MIKFWSTKKKLFPSANGLNKINNKSTIFDEQSYTSNKDRSENLFDRRYTNLRW